MSTFDKEAVTIKLTEPRSVPIDDVVFGGVAMIPFAAGALAVWFGGDTAPLWATLTLYWGALILAFLAGVRRGVSFRTPNGPTVSQLVVMTVQYVLAAGALYVTTLSLGTAAVPPVAIAAGLLTLGYLSIMILDPRDAQHGTMPLHFQRLRPLQMIVPVVSLIAILVYALR